MCLVGVKRSVLERLIQVLSRRHLTFAALVPRPTASPGRHRATLVLKNRAIVQICQLLAAGNDSLAVVLDFAGDWVALHLQDMEVLHFRQDVEHDGVLELIVRNIQHTNGATLGEVRDVLGRGEAVVRQLQRVQALQVRHARHGLDTVI